MSSEIFSADWSIPYPNDFDDEHVPDVLRPFTYVKHEWAAFPWHLAGRMVELLENPQPCFEYIHLTRFFLARATMLAMKGDLLDQKDVCTSLRKHRVQLGGIYREHLLFCLRAFLKKHNLTEFPGCDTEQCDYLQDDDETEKNRNLLQRVLRAAEHDYVKTLNVISSSTDMKERVTGHSVGFWVKGADMPAAEGVPARRRTCEGGYYLLPARDEALRRNRDGGRWEGIVVETREESGKGQAEGGDRRGEGTEPGAWSAEGRRSGEVMATLTPTLSPPKARGRAAQPDTVVEKRLAPVVEMFEKAILAATPPHKRMWWQNLRERYGREAGPREVDKWRAVANSVVASAIEQSRKPIKEWHHDYVTPLMLKRLIGKLNAPGASRVAIEADYADTLRRCVTREEHKAVSQ